MAGTMDWKDIRKLVGFTPSSKVKITKRQAQRLRAAGYTVGTITHTPRQTPYTLYYVSSRALRQYKGGKRR
jgi:hypothetical protein